MALGNISFQRTEVVGSSRQAASASAILYPLDEGFAKINWDHDMARLASCHVERWDPLTSVHSQEPLTGATNAEI